MNQKSGSAYLLTGVIIGILLGIVLSLWVIPVQYVNADPSTLSEKDRALYRILISEAYLAEGDAGRAISRVALMGEENASGALIAQAQNMLAESGDEDQARALALLAAAVNEPSLAITPLPQQVPVTVEIGETLTVPTLDPLASGTAALITGTPGSTSTPRPTLTPMATIGAPYVLLGEPQPVCDPLPQTPLLKITVLNASDQPVAGVKIEISQTSGGLETFFTGLYPEINYGYADYEMLPGVTYSIRVGETGQPVTNLSVPTCGEGGTNFGSLELIFQQP